MSEYGAEMGAGVDAGCRCWRSRCWCWKQPGAVLELVLVPVVGGAVAISMPSLCGVVAISIFA